ncbi:hypothetical protein F2Q70_00043889 [Brassica cretica]|uniref:Uncharacterized protein n=1 Tax=Brassica cretica TaxID=69181 RepID=A0A8S9KLJ4_BRACR|nr:hypothetical protein F2Q70_00043889 [Brassica cretica]
MRSISGVVKGSKRCFPVRWIWEKCIIRFIPMVNTFQWRLQVKQSVREKLRFCPPLITLRSSTLARLVEQVEQNARKEV